MKCPICNEINKESALMCEFCGEKFDKTSEVNISFSVDNTGPKVCNACKKGNKESALMCEFCGEKFFKDEDYKVKTIDKVEDVFYIDFDNKCKKSKIIIILGTILSIVFIISLGFFLKGKKQ